MEEFIQTVGQSIENVCLNLDAGNDTNFDDALTTVDLLVDAISFIDSVIRLPEDIYIQMLWLHEGW